MAGGLLVLRVLVAVVLVAHGTQKLTTRFGGPGIAGTITDQRDDGFGGGAAGAWMAGLTQVVGGALLVFGLATPLAAAMVIGVMSVATSVKAPNGFWNLRGGFEYPALLAGLGVVLACTGPGEASIDELAGWTGPPAVVAAASIGVGLLAAVVTRATLVAAGRRTALSP